MYAADHGHVEVASLLLERGADIEAKNMVRIITPLDSFLEFLFKILLYFLSLSGYLSLHFTLVPCLLLFFSFFLLFLRLATTPQIFISFILIEKNKNLSPPPFSN